MCNHAAKTNASLKKHLQIHSETNDPNVLDFPCPDCNKTFREKKTLQIHSFVHSGHRPISCAICGKTFVTSKINQILIVQIYITFFYSIRLHSQETSLQARAK